MTRCLTLARLMRGVCLRARAQAGAYVAARWSESLFNISLCCYRFLKFRQVSLGDFGS